MLHLRTEYHVFLYKYYTGGNIITSVLTFSSKFVPHISYTSFFLYAIVTHGTLCINHSIKKIPSTLRLGLGETNTWNGYLGSYAIYLWHDSIGASSGELWQDLPELGNGPKWPQNVQLDFA